MLKKGEWFIDLSKRPTWHTRLNRNLSSRHVLLGCQGRGLNIGEGFIDLRLNHKFN